MMQEKNTNNRLKAQPTAYECDLFSGITWSQRRLLLRRPSEGEDDSIYLRQLRMLKKKTTEL